MKLKIFIDNDEQSFIEKFDIDKPTPEKIERICTAIGRDGYFNTVKGCYWPPHRIHKIEVA